MKSVTGSNIPLDRVIKNVTRLKAMRDALGKTSPHIYVKMIDPGDETERRTFLETFGPISDETALEPVLNWNTSQERIDFTTSGQAPLGNGHDAKGKSACPFPFYTLVINSDLRVTVCCVDWEKGTEVGNLAEQSLREIWHGQAPARLPHDPSPWTSRVDRSVPFVLLPRHESRQPRCVDARNLREAVRFTPHRRERSGLKGLVPNGRP
jgi:hypothetical protein